MPYFQLESSHSLPEHRYIPVAFIRTAPVYLQTGDKKAVIELPPSMDPNKTLTHYMQKISVKKSVLAPAKYTLNMMQWCVIHQPPRLRGWAVAAVRIARWRSARHSKRCESSWT